MVGIVVVSHSSELAEGLAALAAQMAGPEVRIEPAGGLPDGEPRDRRGPGTRGDPRGRPGVRRRGPWRPRQRDPHRPPRAGAARQRPRPPGGCADRGGCGGRRGDRVGEHAARRCRQIRGGSAWRRQALSRRRARTVLVTLPDGVDLHARPAADFVRTAMGFARVDPGRGERPRGGREEPPDGAGARREGRNRAATHRDGRRRGPALDALRDARARRSRLTARSPPCGGQRARQLLHRGASGASRARCASCARLCVVERADPRANRSHARGPHAQLVHSEAHQQRHGERVGSRLAADLERDARPPARPAPRRRCGAAPAGRAPAPRRARSGRCRASRASGRWCRRSGSHTRRLSRARPRRPPAARSSLRG